MPTKVEKFLTLLTSYCPAHFGWFHGMYGSKGQFRNVVQTLGSVALKDWNFFTHHPWGKGGSMHPEKAGFPPLNYPSTQTCLYVTPFD